MIRTTSEAVQVPAASSSSSTGEVATSVSPSTTTGGRPAPPPSKTSPSRHRSEMAAVRATSVPPPGGETEIQPVPPHRVHAVVLQEPIESGLVVQLEAEDEVDPDRRAVGVGPALVVAGDRHSGAEERDGDLVVVGKAVQRFEARRKGVVSAVEHADLPRRAQPQARREEVAEIERGADHDLAAAQVDAAPYPEAEQADPGPRRSAADARRLE